MGKTLVAPFLVVLVLAWAGAPVFAASPEEDLWRAAQEGDTALVEKLLEAGVDPDAPARYGVTALGFAAGKGHEAIVRLLLDAGADPNVTDTFYDQQPLGWALYDGHWDVALLLVRRGARPLEEALAIGIRAQRPELVEEVLERIAYYPWRKTVAVGLAESADAPEGEGREAVAARAVRQSILDRVREKPVAEELPDLRLPAERLDAFAGVYVGGDGQELAVTRRGRDLLARLPGADEPVRLRAVGETELRVADDLEVGLVFRGRGGGPSESVMLLEAAVRTPFRRPDEDEPTVAAAPRRQRPEPVAPRTAETGQEPSSHWPSFRGPGARGQGSGDPPTTWSVETGDNILWRSAVPGLGNSSPVVWGNRVFVTTAVAASGDRSLKIGRTGDVSTLEDDSEHTWWVLAFDKATGRELWRREAGRAVPESDRHFKSTQANSTPAVDGQRVVAVFPTVGLVVYDLDGELLWRKDLGALDAGWFYDPSFGWGYGSSPILYDGKVILQVDARDASYLAAWDAATGEPVWRTERGELPTWSTPVVVEGPKGPELVTNGPTIRGYDPATGRELWSLGPNSEMVVATPVAGDGVVYVSAGYPPVRPIYAVRLGGRGDLSLPDGETSNDHVTWSLNRGGAYMPTPILVDGIYYIGHHDSRLIAYDATTGETLYKARFSRGGTFTGSPVTAGGKLYFTTEEGLVYVVKAGPEHEELAVNDLDEITMTTPAVSEGVLILRTRTELIGVGVPPDLP